LECLQKAKRALYLWRRQVQPGTGACNDLGAQEGSRNSESKIELSLAENLLKGMRIGED